MREEKNEALQFPHCIVDVLTSFLHQTHRGFTWCLFPPVVRVHLPWKAGYNQKAPPDPLINLPLAKTEPTRKKTKNKQVQNTIVIGFLKTFPNVLVWSSQTQWLAQDIPRDHEHWLMCNIRTRKQTPILFWATWTGISTTAITAATSKSWPATFTVKDLSPLVSSGILLRPGASSA